MLRNLYQNGVAARLERAMLFAAYHFNLDRRKLSACGLDNLGGSGRSRSLGRDYFLLFFILLRLGRRSLFDSLRSWDGSGFCNRNWGN